MTKRIRKSWELDRSDVHAPLGVETLRKNIKAGLKRKYAGIVESMWVWTLEDERFSDMLMMSADTAPEKTLFLDGVGVWFEFAGQIHFLPRVMEGGLNMYGYPNRWHPIPVGYDENKRGEQGIADEIRNLNLDDSNSVIMRDNLFGMSGQAFMDSMIDEMVDNLLTLNQLQLLAKSPFVFNVSEDNLLSAKNFFLALSSDKPAIFVNRMGETPVPVAEMTGSKIDPALLELFDRWECQLLEYYGIECVPITKRAQQTVSEVESNSAKLKARRQELLHQREMAVERLNKMFGTNAKVESLIDRMQEEAADREEEMLSNGYMEGYNDPDQ